MTEHGAQEPLAQDTTHASEHMLDNPSKQGTIRLARALRPSRSIPVATPSMQQARQQRAQEAPRQSQQQLQQHAPHLHTSISLQPLPNAPLFSQLKDEGQEPQSSQMREDELVREVVGKVEENVRE